MLFRSNPPHAPYPEDAFSFRLGWGEVRGSGPWFEACLRFLHDGPRSLGSLHEHLRQTGQPTPTPELLQNIALMLQSCLEAEGKVGLMMNTLEGNLAAVLAILPALQKPTVSHLSDPAWVALNTIVDENIVRTIIPRLKAAGARGIVEYPISKIID